MRLAPLKRFFVGAPMPLAQARHERLGKAVALAIFASDPLSSVAYATEEILLSWSLAGSAALSYSLPIGVAIATLLAVVVTSYRQTVAAYPQGGGAYVVAKDNLGQGPALVAAAALLTDYVLTVSVSVAAGVAAITSAFPRCCPYRILLGMVAVAADQPRRTSAGYASPAGSSPPRRTSSWWACSAMIAYGLAGAWLDLLPEAPYEPHPPGLEGIGLFLLLRAFAAGCTALTGVEAVSNGVPALRPPEGRNAQTVMTWLGRALDRHVPGHHVPRLRLRHRPRRRRDGRLEGRPAGVRHRACCTTPSRPATMLILLLAANGSYAAFPRLSSILARDRFMPRQFGTQGDRLVFSNGILILSGFAIAPHRVVRRRHASLLPALRDRGLPLVHAVAERHGACAGSGCASPGGAGASGVNGVGRDRHRRRAADPHRRRSSPRAPGSSSCSSRSSSRSS